MLVKQLRISNPHMTQLPIPIPFLFTCTDAVCRFVDFSIMSVAGDNIDVCWKLEDATGEIERPVSLSIRTLNGTAIRMFAICFF